MEAHREHLRPERENERRQEAAEHPEVAAFQQWRAKHQADHPDAAPAWTGKMPLDLLHHAIHMPSGAFDPSDVYTATQGAQEQHVEL